ncbi:MAG TPA: metallophosphoesterase [Steroidobacteraceae bacterium]|nr:metallophosphoesterase [Steroidobacteraceae bacterium]
MSPLIKISVLAILQALAIRALADAPPRLEVAVADPSAPLTFIAYGDTRFTQRDGVANAAARRALVARIAGEKPAAIFIGGDLVYEGNDPEDYETYRTETAVWSQVKIPIFPALGNHEFRGCDKDSSPCLVNWWRAAAPSGVRSFRWYSVALGPKILVLVLDSDSSLKPGSEQRTWFEQQVTNADSQWEFLFVVLHYPPVRDPVFPRAKDEKEIARYLSKHTHSLQARVVVVGSHIHNYERFRRGHVTYLVSGGGGAKPVRVLRLFGELSKLDTAENFHYIRFRFEGGDLQGTMVRFDPKRNAETAWTEPDRFEVKARVSGHE